MKIKIESILLIIATLILILYWGYLIFLPPGFFGVHSNIAIIPKDLNFGEFGSLLSGLFAPLAFIWLFYGYFQQSKSLNILIEERQNKRKVLRPKFELISSERQSHSTDYKTQTYILTFKIQGTAFRLNCSRNSIDDGFIFDTHTYNFELKKNFPPLPIDMDLKNDQDFTLCITVDLHKNTQNRLFLINLDCLDLDGYDCHYKIQLKCEFEAQLFFPGIFECKFAAEIVNMD